jgi:Zn-dependent peptidase ImmA (M78 family)
VVADADATEAERQSLPAAIALWRQVGLTTLTTSAVEGAQVPVRFAVTTILFRGLYEPTLGIVSINRDLDDEGKAITLAHELGHALGLPHVPLEERPSAMNPGNITVLPSLDDYAELERLWRCPVP